MTAKSLLSKITGIPEYRLNDDSGETVIKSGCLLAMEEYAQQEAVEFSEWYSGMDKKKVESAYLRYKTEKK